MGTLGDAAEGASLVQPGRGLAPAGDEGLRLLAAPWDDGLKLVVAVEPRSYREAIGVFFQDVRETLKVSIVDPAALEEEIRRSGPDLVFSSDPNAPSVEKWPAWLEFHQDTYGQAVTFYLDGEYYEIEDADLGDLLSIVDRTERSLTQNPRSNLH